MIKEKIGYLYLVDKEPSKEELANFTLPAIFRVTNENKTVDYTYTANGKRYVQEFSTENLVDVSEVEGYEKTIVYNSETGEKGYIKIYSQEFFNLDNDGILLGLTKEFLLPENTKEIKSQSFHRGLLGSISKISLNKGLKKIGSNAFYMQDIRNLEIPSTVEFIDASAFSRNQQLESVFIAPDAKIEFGASTFSNCIKLSHFDIPKGTTEIAAGMFSQSGLKSIIIPENIKVIRNDAFQGCNQLENVTFSESDANIELESGIFYGCSKLSHFNIPKGITELAGSMFGNSGLKSIIIPENIKKIGYYTFYDCHELEEVTFSESLEFIDYCAFGSCNKLTSVTLGANTHYQDGSFPPTCVVTGGIKD